MDLVRKQRSAWLDYKRESLRYGLYGRRLPLVLLFNVVAVIVLGSLLLFLVEKGANPQVRTYGDAIWCMFVSMATIGYGDVVPITVAGKITVLISMIIGIGALSTYITNLASRRVAKTRRRYSGLEGKIKSKDHIVICGWNSRCPYVLERLKQEAEKEYRHIALLADLEEKPVEDDYVFFLRGNPASENDLRRINIEQAGSVILLADDTHGGSLDDIDSRTVLAALTIRALNKTVKMTAEIIRPENIDHLKLAQVGEVLDSDVVLGNLIARSALHYGLIGIVTEMVARKDDMRIYAMPVEQEMVGKSCDEVVSMLKERRTGKLIGVITGSGFKSYDQPHRMQAGEQLLLIAEASMDVADARPG